MVVIEEKWREKNLFFNYILKNSLRWDEARLLRISPTTTINIFEIHYSVKMLSMSLFQWKHKCSCFIQGNSCETYRNQLVMIVTKATKPRKRQKWKIVLLQWENIRWNWAFENILAFESFGSCSVFEKKNVKYLFRFGAVLSQGGMCCYCHHRLLLLYWPEILMNKTGQWCSCYKNACWLCSPF